MKSSFRPTSIEDLTALQQFLGSVFGVGPDAAFLDPRTMSWKYWDRRDDWLGARSYVLEKDGKILAHAGIWPTEFTDGTAVVRGIHMIDWASAKESPGAGLALLQKLTATFDIIFAIGGSEDTRKVLPAFGFVEQTQQWKGVRPLRPLRQILSHQNRSWKLAPRLVRNTLWAMPKGGTWNKKWTATRILPQQIAREESLCEIAGATFSPRSPAFFDYLLRCPASRFSLHGIFEDGQPRGHFAISVLRGQARVAGVWLQELNDTAWEAAYALAQRTALGLDGAYEIVAAGSEAGFSHEAAARAGFRIVKDIPVYTFNRTKKLTLSPNFQFQLSDYDGAFLDDGTPSYWS